MIARRSKTTVAWLDSNWRKKTGNWPPKSTAIRRLRRLNAASYAKGRGFQWKHWSENLRFASFDQTPRGRRRRSKRPPCSRPFHSLNPRKFRRRCKATPTWRLLRRLFLPSHSPSIPLNRRRTRTTVHSALQSQPRTTWLIRPQTKLRTMRLEDSAISSCQATTRPLCRRKSPTPIQWSPTTKLRMRRPTSSPPPMHLASTRTQKRRPRRSLQAPNRRPSRRGLRRQPRLLTRGIPRTSWASWDASLAPRRQRFRRRSFLNCRP